MKKNLLILFIFFNFNSYAQTIDAVDDFYLPIDGVTGNPNVGNILTNDTLNGSSFTLSQVNLIVPYYPFTPPPPPGLGAPIIDNVTGQVSVLPGSIPGIYNIQYKICDKLNPSIFDIGTARIIIVDVVDVVDAVEDNFYLCNGNQIAGNVLRNDTVNANFATNSNVLLTIVSPAAPQTPGASVPYIDNTGTVNAPENTPSGVYKIVYQICSVSMGTNCDVETVTITINGEIEAIPTIISPATCLNNCATIMLNATGGTPPYQYNFGIGFNSTNTYCAPPGNHIIEVRDALGCNKFTQVFVPNIAPISIATFVNDLMCNGTPTGNITIFASGGGGSYAYSLADENNMNIAGSQLSNIFTGLKAGKYIVRVMDNGGCSKEKEVIINEPSKLTLTGSTTNNTSLINTVTLEANGGSAPYTFAIFNPVDPTFPYQSSPVFTNLVYGVNYCFTVRDSNNCNSYVCSNDLITLSTQDFKFENLKYFPNPVLERFYFSNSNLIDAVSIEDLTGKTILSKNVNSLQSDVDLSSVSKGIYFVKIKSQDAEKIIKIIKE
jgi:hypothetical protein